MKKADTQLLFTLSVIPAGILVGMLGLADVVGKKFAATALSMSLVCSAFLLTGVFIIMIDENKQKG